MQTLINERLVKRESRIGAVLLGLTFATLGLGLFLSLQADHWLQEQGDQALPTWLPVAVTYVIVLLGMGLYYLGNGRVRRFGPQYRQEEPLRKLLKGLDSRYVLYAFLGRKLPDYVLVGPGGVWVLTTRTQTGELTCHDDRWSRKTGAGARIFGALYGNPLGNPSYDCQQGVKQVQALLEEQLPEHAAEVPVSGLVVFTGEAVRLRAERCVCPATTGREVRKVVGKARGRLNQARLGEVRAAFDAVLAR